MPYLSTRINALAPRDGYTGDEFEFKKWYVDWALRTGIDPDPDNPRHHYDYRAAYRAGSEPELADDGLYHWPSEFKAQNHPNRFVNGVDTITGRPVNALRPTPVVAPEQDLDALMGEAEAAAGIQQPATAQATPVQDVDALIDDAYKGVIGEPTPELTAGRLGGAFVAGTQDIVRTPYRAMEGISQATLGKDSSVTGFFKQGAEAPILKTAPEFEGKTSGWVEDFVRSAPQMGSQIILSMAAGPLVGMGYMGLQIAGGDYENLVAQGVPPERAIVAGVADAIMEAPMEQLGVSKITSLFNVRKALIKKMKDVAEALGTEWFTEFAQAFPQSITEIWAKNPDKAILDKASEFLDNAMETAKQGAYEGTLTAPWALLGIATAGKPRPAGAKNALEKKKEEKPPAEATITTTQAGPIPTEQDINRMFEEAEEAAGITTDKPVEVKPEEETERVYDKIDRQGRHYRDFTPGGRLEDNETLEGLRAYPKAEEAAKEPTQPGELVYPPPKVRPEENLPIDNTEGVAEDRIKLLKAELETLESAKGKKPRARRKAIRAAIRRLKGIIATEEEAAKTEAKTIAMEGEEKIAEKEGHLPSKAEPEAKEGGEPSSGAEQFPPWATKKVGVNSQGLPIYETKDGNRVIPSGNFRHEAPRPLISNGQILKPYTPKELFGTNRSEFLTKEEFEQFKTEKKSEEAKPKEGEPTANYKEGDRVVINKAHLAEFDGRHGVISKVDVSHFTMTPVFGPGGVERKTDIRYEVKTDAGVTLKFVTEDQFEKETGKAPEVTPDIEIEPGNWQPPGNVKSNAAYNRRKAQEIRAKAERAKIQTKKARYRIEAEDLDKKAANLEAKYAEWAAKYKPGERAPEKPAGPAVQPVHPAGVKPSVDLVYHETKHTQKGHALFVVAIGDRVSREKFVELRRKAQSMGGYWSRYAQGGAIPGFQFTEKQQAQDFMTAYGHGKPAETKAPTTVVRAPEENPEQKKPISPDQASAQRKWDLFVGSLTEEQEQKVIHLFPSEIRDKKQVEDLVSSVVDALKKPTEETKKPEGKPEKAELPDRAELNTMERDALIELGNALGVKIKKSDNWYIVRMKIGEAILKAQGEMVVQSYSSPGLAVRKFKKGDRVVYSDQDTGERREGYVGEIRQYHITDGLLPIADSPNDTATTLFPKPNDVVKLPSAPTPSEKARETVDHIKNAIDKFKKINIILGEKGAIGGVDPVRYDLIKPLLKEAWDEIVAAGKSAKEFVQLAIQNLSPKGRPYFEKFVREEVSHGNEPADIGRLEERAIADDQGGAAGKESETVPATEEGEQAGGVRHGPGRRDDGDLQGGEEPGGHARRTGKELQEQPHRTGKGNRRKIKEPVGRDTGNVPGILTPGSDYVIPQGGLDRKGGWKTAAKTNLDAIELYKKILSENRPATEAEQQILVKYVGWGATELANKMFPGYTYQRRVIPSWAETEWRPLVDRLVSLLTEEEVKTAARSTQYAHFTSEGVIRSIYHAMLRFGFRGGKILEAGLGIGHFIGLLPESIRKDSIYTGVEMDSISAGIAKLLYPNHNVLAQDFTKTMLPRDFFDAAIGNPPFGSISILADPEYRKFRFKLHNYFFTKSLDRVRPGGVVAFVTSHYTMDSQGKKMREYLSKSADLIGAVRLPQTAFKKNAGTEVVTDVLFLRKRVKGETAETSTVGQDWMELAEVDTPEGKTFVNEYFANHPEMVLGRHSLKGSMRAANEYTVLPSDGDIEVLFDTAVEKLPEGVYSKATTTTESLKKKTFERDYNPKNKKEGGIYLSEKGELKIVDFGSGVDIEARYPKLSAKEKTWLKDYTFLRDVVKQSHYDQLTDGDWEGSLKRLQAVYRKFVKKHGRILEYTTTTRKVEDEDGNLQEVIYRRQKSERLLAVDVERSIVEALEKITEDGSIIESPALSERTIKKPEEPKIESPSDALAVSLNEKGNLDIPHIAELLGMKENEIIDLLGDLIFRHPSSGYMMADEYLSGNVVRKLEEAKAAAKIDPQYHRNVEALRKVQPQPLSAKDVTITPGAPWIPIEYLNDFGEEVLGLRGCNVTHYPASNSWTVTGSFKPQGRRQVGEEFGTADRGANEIFESALNARIIKITRTDSQTKQTYTDTAATTAANEKMNALKNRFASWVWQNGDRARRLLDIYNRQFNNLAPRRFDGSHLTLPGASSLIKLYDHQKRAIWRIIQTGNTYLAHSVGAGKTFVMIAAGMEMKRLGMISKPLYVVPKHMLGQFAREFNELYPMAHVMVADEQNFHTENRRRFVAQATLNNPDAIVVPHSSFGLFSLKEETIKPVRDEFIGQLRDAWEEMRDDKESYYLIKQMEKRIEQAEQRFDRMISSGDKAVTFEQMGVDYLFLDEAHEFRKLDYVTNQKIKGIDPVGSKKAMDLFIKTLWLETRNPGRSHTFASGTPITNTLGELYTVMRFFDPKGMEEEGVDHFDSWSAMFARAAVGYEMNAAGRYQPVERFSKFINIPELMSRVRQFMDVLTMSQLATRVKLPTVRGGKSEIVVAEPIQELKDYQDNVLHPRIVASMKWKPSKEEKGNPDPLINIITDGRLASIDMRFVRPGLAPNAKSKLNRFIDGIIETYNQTKNNEYLDVDGTKSPVKGAVQVCFYNHGFGAAVASNRGLDARAWVMKRLKEAKIAHHHIAWIDDYDTAQNKEALFKELRTGKKRILFGSAKKMGTGMNVQNRLSHLHYLDSPWYPADVEQPMGRIVRQGNQNEEVDVRWYATKGSYDATMWQLVSTKSKFIENAFLGDKDLRSMEDLSESSQYEMASALASGDDRMIRLVALRAQLEKYHNLQVEHEKNKWRLERQIKEAEWSLDNNAKRLEILKRMEKHVPDYVKFERGEIDGKVYDKREEFNDAVIAKIHNAEGFEKVDEKLIGKINGFSIYQTVTGRWLEDEKGHRVPKNKQVKGEVTKVIRTEINLRFERGLDEAWAPIDFTIQRAIAFLNRIDSDIAAHERDISNYKEDIADSNKRLSAPFEFEREYSEVIAEMSRLEAELTAEGEKVQVQALSQMAQESTDENRKKLISAFVSDLAALPLDEDPDKKQGLEVGFRSLIEEKHVDAVYSKVLDVLIDQKIEITEELETELERLKTVYLARESYLDYRAVIGEYPDFDEPVLPRKVSASVSDRSGIDNRVEGMDTGMGGHSNDSSKRIGLESESPARDQSKIVAILTHLLGGRKVETENARIVSPETHQSKVATKVAEYFGHRIVFFESDILVDGVYSDRSPTTLWININSASPLLVTTGHETIHALRNNAPDLYARLDDMLRGNVLGFQDYLYRINELNKRAGIPTIGVISGYEEFYADFLGKQLLNKDFSRKMLNENPSAGRAILLVIMRILRRIANIVRTDHGPGMKDIEKAQDILAQVLREYSERTKSKEWAFRPPSTGGLISKPWAAEKGGLRVSGEDTSLSVGTFETWNKHVQEEWKKRHPKAAAKVAEEEKAYEESFARESFGALKGLLKLWKARGANWRDQKPDTTVLDRIVSVPSHHFEKVPALQRMFEAGLERSDQYYELINALLKGPDGRYYSDIMDTLRKQRPEEFKQFQEYLITRDRNQIGYRVIKEEKANEYTLFDPKHRKVGSFESESTAWAKAIIEEVKAYRESGVSDLAVESLIAARMITHKGFTILIRNLRDIIDKYESNGWDLPKVAVRSDGKGVEVDLKVAIAMMGDMRGYYFPRIRRPGRFMLIARKEGVNPIMEFFDWKTTIARRQLQLEQQGYRVEKDLSPALGEDVFDMAKSIVGMQAQINAALEKMHTRGLTLEDFGLRATERLLKPGKGEVLITGPTSKKHNEVFKQMGGRFFASDPGGVRVWHFENPGPLANFEKRLAKALANAAPILDQETQLLFAKTLAEQVANVVKARGHRAHMIERKMATGVDVWTGYEEDPVIALTKYARGLAAGEAKKNMALRMVRAFTGTDISWQQFKADNSEDTKYEDYLEEVERRRINSSKQPNAFREGKMYLEDMLRNEEWMDRALGTIKGAAVLKYLGFRIAAPVVNLTALVTSVPAVMQGFGGIPFIRSFRLLGQSLSLYRQYKHGDKASLAPNVRRMFEEMERKGWDKPQLNQEGLAVLEGKLGRGWNKLIETSMWMFGITEQLNRVSTIAASYLGVQQVKPELSHEEAMELAKKISDRAHGVYRKGNLPHYARGGHIGAQLIRMFYVFRTFSHNYLLTMKELGIDQKNAKALSYMLVSPALLAGAGATVAAPILQALAKALGIGGDDPEEEFYSWLDENLGEYFERFGRSGLFGLAGVSLKGSLQIGITDLPTSITDILGAPGSVVSDIYQGGQNLTRGDVLKGVEKILPNFAASVSRAFREGTEGVTTKNNGPVFWGREPLVADIVESIRRSLSFNPSRIAGIRERQYREHRAEAYYTERRTEIYSRFKKFYLLPESERTDEEYVKLMAIVQDYNQELEEKGLMGKIPLITSKSIRANIIRSLRPNKRERLRAVAGQE